MRLKTKFLLTGLFVSFSFLLFIFTLPHNAAAAPAGFVKETFIGSGISLPTTIEFAPDGRVFILELTGKVKIYKNGAVLPTTFATVPALANSDRGALGLALDPNWNTEKFVYVYFIDTNDGKHKIWKFNADTDIAGPSTEIYNSNIVAGTNHAGGGLQFGPDGKLYLSIGDSNQAHWSQDITKPTGKMLRINKDGSIPSDNPFFNTQGAEQRIWAYGFRNPFRFQFDSLTGRIFEGDVGDSTWEEINIVEKGKNYGWPKAEGNCVNNCAGLTDPLFQYQHIVINGFVTGAVTGGFVYRGNTFPAEYNGRYFYADFTHGFIRQLVLAENNGVVSVVESLPFDGGRDLVDLKQGPDGALYAVSLGTSKIERIRYQTNNLPPVAVASADKTTGNPPLVVQFSSAGSSDPEASTLTYVWDFGDGTTSSAANPTKTYTQKGKYIVKLAVSDGVNTTNAAPITIQASTPPVLNIVSPVQGAIYKAGDIIAFNSEATDSDGNVLPNSAFTTEVRFNHHVHFHPILVPTQIKSGQFIISKTNETSEDVWYEVIVTATDSLGATTTKAVTIFPKLSNNVVTTNPVGLSINVDDQPKVGPFNFTGVVGIVRKIEAPNQIKDGKFYQFESWSDGGGQAHSFDTPDTNTIYTAKFKEVVITNYFGQYYLGKDLAGSPVLQRDDLSINFDWGGGSPDPVLPKDNFSVRWTRKVSFAAGKYTFVISSDDGSRLFIDGQKVVDDWSDHPVRSKSGSTDLSTGEHEIKMEYYEAGGGAIAKLSWSLDPSQPVPPPVVPQSWKGEYFGNVSLSGVPTLTRDDKDIAFQWNQFAPDVLLPADNFSARWTRAIVFDAAKYSFVATADDGVRVYIDNELVLDKWKDQSTTYTFEKILTAGAHDVKVEYYERGGHAKMFFSWTKVSDTPMPPTPTPTPTNGFTAEYFDNMLLQGVPKVTKQEPKVSFNWDRFSPDNQIPNDRFSARFTGAQVFEARNYTFSIGGDDGIRLYIDGEKVIDAWVDQSIKFYQITKAMAAGTHTVKVEYYENGGSAEVYLNWQ